MTVTGAEPATRRTTDGITLRPGRPEDAQEAGRICFEAFRALSEAHGFPADFPSAEIAAGALAAVIAGVGPVTVDPEAQDSRVGTHLMLDVIERARRKGFAGTRLLQAAYHNRSLALYAKLGFDVREAVVTLQGSPVGEQVPGFSVRPASEDDLEATSRVCRAVHGHDRAREVADAIRRGSASVVVHGGAVVGYTTGVAFFGHSVATSNHALVALIAAAREFGGPGFLLPVSNGEVFRWVLANGLRVVQVMTLMSLGLYHEPRGAYLPSILY